MTFILRDPRSEYYRSCADSLDSAVEGRGSSYKEAFEDATNMAPTADCIISAFAEHIPSGTVEVTTSGGSSGSGGPGTIEDCGPSQTTVEYKEVTNKEDIPEGISNDDIEPLYGDPKPVKKRHQCLESEWKDSMGTKIEVIQGAIANEKDESSISIFDSQTGESIRIISAKSGADGTAYYNEHMPVYDGDLPFPRRYLPDSFTPKEPLQTFTGRSKYRSVLTDKKVGHSGPGAYPIIQRVTGNSKLILKVNSEHQVGSVQLSPLSSSGVSCAKGVTKEGSNCGSPASSGSAGAASISW